MNRPKTFSSYSLFKLLKFLRLAWQQTENLEENQIKETCGWQIKIKSIELVYYEEEL
jgi:hypothetical protein